MSSKVIRKRREETQGHRHRCMKLSGAFSCRKPAGPVVTGGRCHADLLLEPAAGHADTAISANRGGEQ